MSRPRGIRERGVKAESCRSGNGILKKLSSVHDEKAIPCKKLSFPDLNVCDPAIAHHEQYPAFHLGFDREAERYGRRRD